MKYSGKKTLPGKKNFMCMDELRKLIIDSEVEKDITEREIALCW